MIYERITYSLHALAQMHVREITPDRVAEAIRTAAEITREGERLIALCEQPIGPWLRIVYVERAGVDGLEAHVITA